MKKTLLLLSCAAFLLGCGQPKKQRSNDSNTPLHLVQPDYKIPYGVPTQQGIKDVLDRVFAFVDSETPTQLIDRNTGDVVLLSDVDQNTRLKRGAFRLASYEWGVTYAGMLHVGAVVGDEKFTDYALRRLNFLQQAEAQFRKLAEENEGAVGDPQMRQLMKPHALDDAGAMCAAFIKAAVQPDALKYDGILNTYMRWIMEGQLRLRDGTLARHRPHRNTLWLDDMFMSIPAIALMGKHTGEKKYYDEAVKQIRQFAARMFVPEKNLFMHGWVEGMEEHPAFFWARANGWAVMTLVETLEVLPKNHAGYKEVLDLLRRHIKGLAALQSGEGLWHQLLDRNDSYLETSATAIYAYAIARAVNRGWVDAKAYGPCAVLAWNAVAQQVDEQGHVRGTCVGTGMAFDHAFYYYRPINVFAAHGYGPVLLAGAETIALLKKFFPKMNDITLQFYLKEQTATVPTFNEDENNTY